MMVKLFCFSAFGRKGKATKALVRTDMDSKDLGSDLSKITAVSEIPILVKDPAMQLGIVTNSQEGIETNFSKHNAACEGDCFSGEPLSKSHVSEDEEAFASRSRSGGMSLGQEELRVDEASVKLKEDLTPGKRFQGVFVRPNVAGSSNLLRVYADQTNADADDQGILQKLYIDGIANIRNTGEARRYAIFHYSPDEAILSLKCNMLAWDEDVPAEHVSDPGVYQGEEIHSLNGFSVMRDDGSVMHSLALEASPNVDSHSHMSGEVNENISVGSYGHCSEPTYTITEIMYSRPNCLSTAYIPGSHISQHNRMADASPIGGEKWEQHFNQKSYSLIQGEGACKTAITNEKLKGKVNDFEEAEAGKFPLSLQTQSLSEDLSSVDSLKRVKEWISMIQQPDILAYEEMGTLPSGINEEFQDGSRRLPDIVTVDRELARAATRGLSAYSTVAHMAGIGLKEVPLLGTFSCLKTLNLSANYINRIGTGCLPQSLHTVDFSRNRISQIEGFRDLSRLRELNLSYNRISRIGHGLANCTLIKELYLAGNKVAEVDGLHRLLKLTVLDLSDNKIAMSKALGQLAANYSSLLALNLLGNPISMNVGEDQLRKLITSLTPHVTYLNKQPIKAISVREAVVDNVARAALGSSQRNNKSSSSSSRALRKIGVQSTRRKRPSQRSKDLEKKTGSNPVRSSKHHHHHHGHNYRDDSIGLQNEKDLGKKSSGPLPSLRADVSGQAMHRSKSDGALQDD